MNLKRKALQHEINKLKNKLKTRSISSADKKKARAELELKQKKLDDLMELANPPINIHGSD